MRKLLQSLFWRRLHKSTDQIQLFDVHHLGVNRSGTIVPSTGGFERLAEDQRRSMPFRHCKMPHRQAFECLCNTNSDASRPPVRSLNPQPTSPKVRMVFEFEFL